MKKSNIGLISVIVIVIIIAVIMIGGYNSMISKKENVKTDNSRKASYNSHETKLKFSYMEQKEYESIDDDIEKLENEIARLDEEIVRNTSAYSKLVELTQEKEKIEKMLEEKMERWEYLNELADKIEKQKTR